MRVGDFGVELVPVGEGAFRETDAGHVLARPGPVYGIRLRTYGPLRAVVDVRLDDKSITANGLVIDANSAVTLERPVHASEAGRFTVIAEGDETVFGPDGGRDNPSLGAIVASFRRELPASGHHYPRPGARTEEPRSLFPLPGSTGPTLDDFPIPPPPPRPMAPPEWSPPTASARAENSAKTSASFASRAPEVLPPPPRARSVEPEVVPAVPQQFPTHAMPPDAIERAAGTGLTGRSSQEFVPVSVGTLEMQATVIRLRLVIGTAAAINAPRPLRDVTMLETGPARPPARP
jgi:hypothetical protein